MKNPYRIFTFYGSLFAIFSLVSLFFCVPSVFAESYKFNYTWFAPTTEPHTPPVNYFIDEINKRTQGNVKITYYPGGSLVKGPQAWDAVKKGVTDIDFPCMVYTPKRFPLTYAWGLPLGIKDAYTATRIFNESYEKFKPKEMDGVKILYIWGSPPMQLQTLKPLDTGNENLSSVLKGRKIRCNGVGADFVKQLEGTPVAMPSTQIYEALQKGVVDGNIIASQALLAFKIGELANYEYQWNISVVPFICIMNQKKWDSLPDDIKKVFEEVSQECMELESKSWEEAQKPGRAFGVQNGMQVVDSTPEIDAALAAASRPLYDNYVKDLQGQGMGEEGKAFIEDLLQRVEKYQQ
jgi:TRAP-type C4-dicarboxylate transport system substrate-binding protein